METLPEEHQGYLFDLDGTEVKDGENLGGKYTVDSYTCGAWLDSPILIIPLSRRYSYDSTCVLLAGNWTRFVKCVKSFVFFIAIISPQNRGCSPVSAPPCMTETDLL